MPRRTLVVLGCLLVLVLPACTSRSRLCDRAATLAGQAKLAEAAQAYAQAQRDSDDSCAAEGLDRVAELQADAFKATARGRAAEAAGDRRGAESAYQAALAVDQGAAEAAAGLRRVTRRPAAIDPVWFRAQRLLDEGYEAAARAEVVAVLKAHPDRTVPRPLAHLSTTSPSPVPSSAPAPAAAAPPAPAATPGWVVAVLLVLTGGMVIVAGWAARQLRRIGTAGTELERRVDALTASEGAVAAGLRSELADAKRAAADDLRATRADVRRTAAAAADLGSTIADVRRAAADDAARAGQDRQRFEATVARQREQLGRLFRTVSALRSGAAPVVEESYDQGRPAHPEDTP